MLLNLNLIAGKMNPAIITASCIKNIYEFHIEYPVFYGGGPTFSEQYLYVAHHSQLPESPVFSGHCSIISIGAPPRGYDQDSCDLLCVREALDAHSLFNDLLSIVNDYQKWDDCLRQALYRNLDFQQIGEILFQQFNNPTQLLNVGDRYLFHIYDKNNAASQEYFETFCSEAYPPIDELQVIYSTEGVMETFGKQYPELLENALYDSPHLYANLFVEGRYVGRLFVSGTYQQLKPADYSLIYYASRLLSEPVDATNQSVAIHSMEMQRIILGLLEGTQEYTAETEQYLGKKHWNRFDAYQCAALWPTEQAKQRQFSEHAAFLHNLIADCYPIVTDEGILVIFHQATPGDGALQLSRLQMFIQTEGYAAGCSGIFSDFSKLRVFYRQALEALSMPLGARPAQICCFNEKILEYVWKLCLEQHPADFYLTHQLKELMAYDRKNQTELYKTLQVYLENGMNVARCLEALYIHRSTFHYRITKIEKMLQLSLDFPKHRQYLQFAMGLLDYEDRKTMLEYQEH